MIDNVVVPVASGYGLADEYAYLKNSVREFLTGLVCLICLCTSCSLVGDQNICSVVIQGLNWRNLLWRQDFLMRNIMRLVEALWGP